MTTVPGPTRPHVKELDWIMLSVVGLCCLGLVMAVSINGSNERIGPMLAMKRQGIELFAAMVGFLVMALCPMQLVRRAALPAFLAFTALCVAARFVSDPWNGAYRWIQVGRFQFQPVEAARFCLILLTAHLLARPQTELRTFWKGFVPPMAALSLLVAALFMQPDHGSALICCALVGVMALAAGVRIRHFLPFGIAGIAGLAWVALRHDYVQGRVAGFLDVAPYQVRQSLVAIASGGSFGKGLGEGWMKMGFVPEAENDFVFAVVAEELGFVGSALVLVLYSVLGVMGYRLTCRIRDPFLRYVVFGFVLMLCMQAAVNLLVVSGWAPAKGIDLPFVSTGGTSLVFCLAAVGLIGNAARTDLGGADASLSNNPGRV
jgi:cell division protein FtsW